MYCQEQDMKLVFTGGGSGGHTMPAIAMIEYLRSESDRNGTALEIEYIGSNRGIERTVCEKHGVSYHPISTGKLRRYFSVQNLLDVSRVIRGYFQAKRLLNRIKPDVVVSTGGFVSVPPVVAAGRRGIKVLVHEQTIEIGLANRIASRYADIIAVTFAESLDFYPKSKAVVTGLPLRSSIFGVDRKSALEKLGFDSAGPVLYVTGGGLGSHIINKNFIQILGDLLEYVSIIYQSGRPAGTDDYEQLMQTIELLPPSRKKRIRLFDFIGGEIADVMACTDLAVGRAGAGTVNEFMALSIPAIYIPLAIAMRNEQYKNARVAEKAGGAVIIEEDSLNPIKLLTMIRELLEPEKLEGMKKSLRDYKYKNGTESVCNNIMKLARNL
jgi:UDP-N-acetylglucosamine--N-acetylmuramyl-(pentapeptide) pyrophosphoryl-undecaprenol N-acetylglucosamine transferase